MNLTLKAREVFANDHYATEATGATIDKVERRMAECSLTLADKHRNALGAVMGGVMFTLADLAFAAAAKAQHLEESYFYDKFQVDKEYFKKCHEMAIMCVLTEMADVSQKAFLDYVFDNYKSGRYDQ